MKGINACSNVVDKIFGDAANGILYGVSTKGKKSG
jgi:hypothetical protein